MRDFMTGKYEPLGNGPQTKFSMVIPVELKERLRAEARRRGTDCSALVREYILETLNKSK